VLICPACRHPESRVLETRAGSYGIRRRRQCHECGYRFTTMERIELKLPVVVKKDGSREAFDEDKVLRGLRVACRKRPLSLEDVEEAANRVKHRLTEMNRTEIDSDQIGRAALEELKSLDPVAYLRFASVYLEVDSVQELTRLVEPWMGPNALPWGESKPAPPGEE
jgi:transcriptional repressor NrdR